MPRRTLLTREFNNTSEMNMNNSLAGVLGDGDEESEGHKGAGKREWIRGKEKRGERIVIVAEVRQSSENVTSRGIYMEIPHAFGETCFSPRLVSSRGGGRRGFRIAYINTTPRTNYARPRWLRFSGNYSPVPLRRSSSFPSPPSFSTARLLLLVLGVLLLFLQPFRSQYLFCLDRSTRSLTHSGSRYIARDRPDTSGSGGGGGIPEFGSSGEQCAFNIQHLRPTSLARIV